MACTVRRWLFPLRHSRSFVWYLDLLGPQKLHANDGLLPTKFYIVSNVTSDASPFWYHYILEVAPEGRDSVIRYVRIAPMDSMCTECTESIVVEAATARLSGVSPSDLAAQCNPCAIDAASLTRNLKRRTRTAAIYDSVRFGIVANCGSREVLLRLPHPEQVNLELLRKTSPALARWWDLEHAIIARAFGPDQVFYGVSAEQEENLQREGEIIVPDLLSGRFDRGLDPSCPSGQPCTQPSFRDDLRGYGGPLGVWGHTPRLIQAEEYRFKRYVPPKYPPLAMQARISGTVRIDLTVDPKTGEVRGVRVVSGHPLFRKAVVEAAQQWQFVPEQLSGESQSVPADLVFEFRCPERLGQ
jgi:TonB family protein